MIELRMKHEKSNEQFAKFLEKSNPKAAYNFMKPLILCSFSGKSLL